MKDMVLEEGRKVVKCGGQENIFIGNRRGEGGIRCYIIAIVSLGMDIKLMILIDDIIDWRSSIILMAGKCW